MKKKVFTRALNLIGILLMITVILLMVPLTVPKLFGLRIYGVLTGSMTPAYSIGGVVYVSQEEPENIEVGDVITFSMGTNTEYVMTHRVVENTDGFFITKGDANKEADPEPVAYERLIGRVVYFLPGMAGVADFVDSVTGKSVLIMLFAASFICWVVADMLTPSSSKKKKNSALSEKTEADSVKKKITKKSGFALQLIGAACMTGAAVYLISVLWGYQESTEEYDELAEAVFEDSMEMTSETAENTWNTEAMQSSKEEISLQDKKVLEQIVGLHEQNEDVVGWIRFDTLDISYPIMQAEDNDYYLTHTFSKEENSAGSIFMEASNSADFNDCHTIIYGHNMKNKSMFGSLKDYKAKDHYDGNEYFSIYTLDTVYRYQIFAYYDISMYGDVYNNQFGPDDYFGQFIDTMINRSYYDTGVKPVKTDKIITLSTCSTEGKRFVVNAVRVD